MKIKLTKPLKIVLFIVGIIVSLFLLISVLISPIAHWYIEKNSKQICNRVVTMDKLRINLFNGSVDIKGFKALEENDNDVFWTFNELYVNANLWKLIGRNVSLTEITLDTPDIKVIQNGKRFNFSDIIDFYRPDKNKKKKEKKHTWTVDLQNIKLISGNVIYQDAQVGSCFNMKQLAIEIPQIHFNNQKTDVGLNLKFANGGDLAVKLLYSLEKGTYDLKLGLKKFDVTTVTPYLQQFLNISQIKGLLTTNLNVHGNLNHILEITGNGNVNLNQVSATTKSAQPIAQIDNLQVNIKEIDTKNNVYHLSSVTSSGLHAHYTITKDGKTFDDFVVKREKKDTISDTTQLAQKEKRKVNLLIDNISVKNSDFTYKDETLRNPIEIPVSQIAINATHFSLDEPMSLNLSALVSETGELKVNCDGNIRDFSNLKLDVFLSNFKLNTISPYSIEYLAYPISDGVLSFVSNTTVVNNMLDSKNKIDIYNCVVDKKLKGVKSEYKIPLRAAVFVLADRKGKINLDLPVSGDISSPTFSYRKIIWKTFCNLIIKVAAAPIDIIAKAIGGEPDLFADLQYEIHPQGLGSESDDRLNKIVDAMKSNPDLILTLQQSLNMEENVQEYALFDAKCKYYKAKNNTTSFSMEDYTNITNIKNTDSDFVKYVNKQLTDNVRGDIYEKCLTLVNEEEIKARVKANANRRNEMLIKHFTTQGISSSRLEILPLGNKSTPKGKTILSFGAKICEE